jgi:hypothetical protein
MPIFSDRPPSDLGRSGMRIVRTPADRPLVAYITSNELIGCPTHFVNHRTIPCEGEDVCEHCHEGIGWRWHAYLAIVLVDTHEHVILELTKAACDPFRVYADWHGDLRGAKIKAWRVNKRINGRILTKIKPPEQNDPKLPDPPLVSKILCHMWGVPFNAVHRTADTHAGAVRLTVDASKGDGRHTL